MENKNKIQTPRYQKIAVDIASKIANGKYNIGDKIYARSSLASQYGVSSETARRAICVLSDLDIVTSEKGSGVTIKSYENAVRFIKQYQDVQTIHDIKKNILDSVNRQKKELEFFDECLTDLIAKTDRFRSLNPFMPFQITITSDTPFLNKNISDLNFWQNTGATVIGIKRNDDLLLSPGPYASMHEHDVLYFIGDDICLERVTNFLYPEK